MRPLCLTQNAVILLNLTMWRNLAVSKIARRQVTGHFEGVAESGSDLTDLTPSNHFGRAMLFVVRVPQAKRGKNNHLGHSYGVVKTTEGNICGHNNNFPIGSHTLVA